MNAASFLVEPSRFMGVRGSISRSSSVGASTIVGVVGVAGPAPVSDIATRLLTGYSATSH